MKGGKGGLGRKKPTGKVVESAGPKRSAARGAPKRDWGAIPTDRDEAPPTPLKPRTSKDK
ncbi:MAG: hypothetical protein H7099_04120 [Gemmatimonadaceae bacterium]|nr:hypothetical protein [Gemmatimonadaceae bacterium]